MDADADADGAIVPTNSKNEYGSDPKQIVPMRINFAPLRPFSCLPHLVLTHVNGGGRWRFNLALEATEPAVDDVIEIESPLNKPASVAFRLCKRGLLF